MNKEIEDDYISSYVELLKKVDGVLKRGAVRGKQKYTFNSAFSVNCLGHAVFNFQNKDIGELASNHRDELRDFFWLFERVEMFKHKIPSKQLCKKAEQDLFDKVHLAGLEIEECDIDDEVREGQYKIAYYFDSTLAREDFHFMRQEPDGKWSSKAGMSLDVEEFSQLPKKFKDYKLIKIFKVTNQHLCKDYVESE